MIRKDFPDLQWLKKQIEAEQFKKTGWPNVVIHAIGKREYRPDIKGTLSLFMNMRGESRCGVGKGLVRIEPGYFFLTNQYQPYTLEIENTHTETFNIHFGEKLVSEVFAGLEHSPEQLTDNPQIEHSAGIAFYNRLYPKDDRFKSLMAAIYCHSRQGWQNALLLEEQLTEVLVYLLSMHQTITRQVHKLVAVKKSTQVEVYKRLCLSLNYLHSYYSEEISLDDLARIACLSKFHYLRMFKAVFGLSPYQFLLTLRLEKARELLKHSQLPVTEISTVLGFQNSSSFSRLFHQRFGYAPVHYRMENTSRKIAILVN
ncbi:helix-turn-helix domain-containing protein [Rhodocytophaga aerolata]|uniref:Helix-turn-helix domain-containing protein n=1 Tax=Rhodocytophaga aerolata TaxID=455078 RepID=A0ABT8R7D9_9BACT|nr:helix-turn-helix domain-containing protein [Rhodocytophaga aerolata]MDO1447874.1 helix-turn-helix domain-containing protein [Rhodocytophaga aerolata]